MQERRKNQRFKIKKDFLIVHFNNIGRIRDISLGGMCCSCLNNEFDPKSHNKIDIRCLKNNFYLQNIGVKLLSSKVIDEGEFTHLFTRKCRLQFDRLTPRETEKLTGFISENAQAD
ncbi:MAG: PilZ domain-containing protein [Desulfobulbaceae bacterium]|nr:PilZ domain-containing protein [Desulfobulbaceae bacterium]